MALKTSGFLRDSFLGAAYAPLGIFADALVEVLIPGDPNKEVMDPNTGAITGGEPIAIWEGWGALTPNMDWRARSRRWAFEDTATHAYRVQLRHIDDNLLVFPEDRGRPEFRVSFGEGLLVRVLQNRSDEKSVGLLLVVRNAITDNNKWQPTLLCDINTDETFVEAVDRG